MFSDIQLSHYVPTTQSDLSRVRTGYEKIISQYTKPPFAYAAKENGVVIDLDEKIGMLKVKYKDNTIECVSFGDEYHNNYSGGFYTTQNIVLNNVKKGDKVKQGDVLCYNEKFFSPDVDTNDVSWKIGVNSNVAFIELDETLDDSSAISRTLANRLSFQPVFVRDIVLTKNTNVYQYAAIGTHLRNIDALLTFDDTDIPESMRMNQDEEFINIVNNLNRKTPRAKHAGEIVKIEAFYKCDISEMSESLAAIVRSAAHGKNRRARFADGTTSAIEHPPSRPLKSTDKLGTVSLDEDTVILKFYIQETNDMESGSKLIFSSALKSVVAKVYDDPITTEDGSIEVDALMSSKAEAARIVLSPTLTGTASRVLVDMEKHILDEYFKE